MTHQWRRRVAATGWAGAAIVALAACRTIPPPVALDYRIEAEASVQGAPRPAGESIRAEAEVKTYPEVLLSPAAAEGYELLPEADKQLYDRTATPIQIHDVIRETLANNRDIRIEKYTLEIAEAQVPIARSIYDLLMTSRAQATKVKQQTATSLSAGTRRDRLVSFGVSQLLPSGAVAELAYSYNRVNQIFQFSALNPAIAHALTLTVAQPILRGFGPSATNVDIHIARLGRQASSAEFEAQLQNQLLLALDAYWELVFEIERYDVVLIAYLAARELLRVNEAKAAVGLLAPTQVLQARAAVEERREFVIRQRQAVRDAEDRLKLLMLFRRGSPDWGVQPAPAQTLGWREYEVDEAAVMAEALAGRPELRALESRLAQRHKEIVRAMDELKPRLDVIGEAGVTGLNSNGSEAFDSLETADFNNFLIALQFSMPLQNRAARYGVQQSQSAEARALEEFLRQRDLVEFDVRVAVRELRTDRQRIDITRSRVESAAANLNAERRRLEVGDSTDFQVLELQEDLANAQEAHIRAIVDYNMAINALERARGTLLTTYGVEIGAPELRPGADERVGFPIRPDR